MHYENVELHNVAEITPDEGGGVRLQRVPEDVRKHLNDGAKLRVLNPASGEIRFAFEGPSVRVTLRGIGGGVQVVPFFGGFRCAPPVTVGAEPTTLEFTMPESFERCLPMLQEMDMPFAPRVCRLVLGGEQVCFHGVDGDGIRPPSADELPRLRLLTYGTSITHGAAASWPHLSYAAQTARRLGADLINLGVGGSCHCEPEFADHIAGRTDWRIAVLALSVNMMAFTREEFRKRVTYLVNTVAGADHGRPVACITLYRYFGDREFKPDEPKADEFREILRETVAACPHPNVHVLEGREMLADPTGLTTDLIHPADDGMIQMGESIARRLLPLLGRL